MQIQHNRKLKKCDDSHVLRICNENLISSLGWETANGSKEREAINEMLIPKLYDEKKIQMETKVDETFSVTANHKDRTVIVENMRKKTLRKV